MAPPSLQFRSALGPSPLSCPLSPTAVVPTSPPWLLLGSNAGCHRCLFRAKEDCCPSSTKSNPFLRNTSKWSLGVAHAWVSS
jgi:hypothetical protein